MQAPPPNPYPVQPDAGLGHVAPGSVPSPGPAVERPARAPGLRALLRGPFGLEQRPAHAPIPVSDEAEKEPPRVGFPTLPPGGNPFAPTPADIAGLTTQALGDLHAIALAAQPWQSIQLGPITSARNGETIWSAQTGSMFLFGGFVAKETSGAAIAAVDLVDDAGNSLRAVEYIDLAASETARENYPHGVLVAGGRLVLVNIVGTLSLTVRVRDGQ